VRGVGTANAAISIVNALPLGVGAAAGVAWPARASAVLANGSAGTGATVIEPRGSRTSLVRATARASRERFAPGVAGRLSLRVRSTIPHARGLKSSSAVGSAVALATARACGTEPSPREVAKIVAEVGRSTGLSATGAFDDALAGLVTGWVVTDNRADRELRRFRLDPSLGVVLWIPRGRHPSSPAVRARFRRNVRLARRAVDAALDGDWAGAVTANTALVERAMGYRYAPLHEAVQRAGAVASGVSGLGPAFAAVAPAARIARVLRALPTAGTRRALRFTRRVPDAGGGPT
jgi:shikimate kinase